MMGTKEKWLIEQTVINQRKQHKEQNVIGGDQIQVQLRAPKNDCSVRASAPNTGHTTPHAIKQIPHLWFKPKCTKVAIAIEQVLVKGYM